MKKKLFTILTVVLGIMFMVSCKSNDDPTPNPVDTSVNEDILGIMTRNYLWELPANPNIYLGTEDFFKSLLSKYDVYTDGGNSYNYSRISAVSDQVSTVYDPGFEYAINNYTGGVTYYVILYVKPGTSADDYLLRGMYITTVNGVTVTALNAPTLLYDAYSKGADMKLSIRTPQITNEQEVTIKPYANYVEKPLYISNVLTGDNLGSKKVGYILYNHFSSGPKANDYSYDNTLAAKLAEFKSQGVTTLVFDVRYNSGGSTSAIQSLGSALVKGRETSKAFIEQIFRADLPKPNIPLNFVDKTAGGTGTAIPKLGDDLDKIYIITGQATAGAPEALINALQAYRKADIVLVGEKTKGRTVATASTQDASKKWNLRIAVSYLADVNKSYNYASGFTPEASNIIKEVQANANANNTILGELGNKNEIILSHVLDLIAGNARSTSVDARSSAFDREVKTSLSHRPGANETTVELSSLK